MSRRAGALVRAFAAGFSRGPLMVLMAMVAVGGLSGPASAVVLSGPASTVVRDYALCFGDEKSADDDKGATAHHRIAACTVIVEDLAETSLLRAKAYFYRARARDDKEDWDGAIADCGEAIALDPKRASAYYNRGADWFNKGDDDRAIADFTATIALEPSAGDAFASRGAAFLRQRKIDAANRAPSACIQTHAVRRKALASPPVAFGDISAIAYGAPQLRSGFAIRLQSGDKASGELRSRLSSAKPGLGRQRQPQARRDRPLEGAEPRGELRTGCRFQAGRHRGRRRRLPHRAAVGGAEEGGLILGLLRRLFSRNKAGS